MGHCSCFDLRIMRKRAKRMEARALRAFRRKDEAVATLSALLLACLISLGVIRLAAPAMWSSSPNHRDMCKPFAEVDAVIFTLVQRDDVERYIERFDYVSPRFLQILFYGEGTNYPLLVSNFGNVTVVRLPVANTYPPRVLEVRTMEFLSKCINSRNRFMLRMDLDAFVSPAYMSRLLTTFDGGQELTIMGKAALGVAHEKGKLGLPDGVPFCMGGSTVAYGRGVFEAMRGKWDPCARNPVTLHSDTESQRCIYQAINISCTEPPKGVRLVQIYRRDVQFRLPSSHAKELVQPDSYLAEADVVHPLKHDLEFQQVRYAAMNGLAPPVKAHQMIRHTYASLGSICTLNVFAQRQVSSCSARWNGDPCSIDLKRCPPGQSIHFTEPYPMFILSMEGPEREMLFNKTTTQLLRSGMRNITRVLTSPALIEAEIKLVADWARDAFRMIEIDDRELLLSARNNQPANLSSAQPSYVPTIGEIAVRAAQKNAIMQGITSGAEYFIVGEDDVVPIKSLQHHLRKTMAVGCGRYMDRFAGILLLGASEWNQRWDEIDPTIYRGCYDVHDRTFGAFAVMYNKRGADATLKELADRPNAPVDHAFYLAAMQGAFSAVTVPNLFVVDHRSKQSSVNTNRAMDGRDEMEYRAERNRWNLSNYDFVPPWRERATNSSSFANRLTAPTTTTTTTTTTTATTTKAAAAAPAPKTAIVLPRPSLSKDGKPVITVASFYGPNNQVLSHISGIMLARRCNLSYYDAPIRRHFTDRVSRGAHLSEILDNVPVHLAPEFDIPNACYIGSPAPTDNMSYYLRPFVRSNASWVNITLDAPDTQVCHALKQCRHTFVHVPFRHQYTFLPTSSPMVLHSSLQEVAWKLIKSVPALPKGFHCLLVRQRDDRFKHPDPFADLPMCARYSDTFDCIVNLVRRLRAKRGDSPVLLVTRSFPQAWKPRIASENVYNIPSNDILNPTSGLDVFLDMAMCNFSSVIAYTDDMSKQVGLGGGPTTIYEALAKLGRNTTKDVPFTELLKE